MSDLKSLAHPDWPYAGSPHEWRGFVKKDWPANEGRHYAPVTPIESRHVERLRELAIERLKDHKGVLDSLPPEQHRTIAEMDPGPAASIGIYQKQNYGRLD